MTITDNDKLMNPPAVELQSLRAFVALAAELHFGRAAARLRVAQPALSQQIQRLEARLGFQLFQRTSRKVEFTPAGRAFLEYVERLFIELDGAVENGRNIASGNIGTVTVGYVAIGMVTILPDIVRRFRRDHPNVRLLLRELSSVFQIEALQREQLDIAIVTGRPHDSSIACVEILRDRLVALVREGHPAGDKRSISVSALAADPLILFPRSQTPPLYDRIMAMCRKGGFEPAVDQEAQSWHMIAALVATGLGVSIVPSSVRHYRVRHLRFIPLRPAAWVSMTMCYRRAPLSGAAALFVETARHSS